MRCPECKREVERLHPPIAAMHDTCESCLRDQEKMLDRARFGGQSSLNSF